MVTWHSMLDVEAHVMRLYPGSVVHVSVVYINSGCDHVPIPRDRHERMRPISHWNIASYSWWTKYWNWISPMFSVQFSGEWFSALAVIIFWFGSCVFLCSISMVNCFSSVFFSFTLNTSEQERHNDGDDNDNSSKFQFVDLIIDTLIIGSLSICLYFFARYANMFFIFLRSLSKWPFTYIQYTHMHAFDEIYVRRFIQFHFSTQRLPISAYMPIISLFMNVLHMAIYT